MRTKGSGVVINVSSIAGRIPSNPTMAPYNASKCGLSAVSESLAMEVEQFGIRVRCVEPGFFKTEIAANAVRIGAPDSPYAGLEAAMAAFYDDNVAKGGDPDLVAEAIVAAADDPEPWPVHRLVGPDADMLVDAAAAMPEVEWVRMTKTLSGLA
jgi:NAD(P)-dependent dehydrogenase (short-subunit alcohol dehydrogenase family)